MVISPLLCAGTPVWATGIILILIFTSLITWCIAIYTNPLKNQTHRLDNVKSYKASSCSFIISPMLYVLIIISGLTLVQLIPFSISIYKVLSPFRYETLLKLLPSHTQNYPLSLSPLLTSLQIVKILGYSAWYFLILNLLNTPKRFKQFVYVIIGIAFFETLYGIIEHYGGTHRIFFWKNPYAGNRTDLASLTGTFINRNHYCSFLALCFWIITGYLLDKISYSWSVSDSWKEKILFLCSEQTAKILLMSFIPVCIGLVILLTGSRGGVLNLSIGFFCLLILMLFTHKFNFKILLTLFCILVTLGILFIQFQEKSWIISQVSKTTEEALRDESFRWTNWKDALTMSTCFQFIGTGFGTFKDVYPQFQTQIQLYWDSESSDMIIDHAHNDFLELFSEVGVIGTTFFLFAITLVIFRTIRIMKYQNCNYFLRVCSLSAVLGFLSHSFFEFNMHIPANVLLFLVVLSFCEREVKPENQDPFYNIKAIKKPWLVIGLVCLSLWGIVNSYHMVKGDFLLTNIKNKLQAKSTDESKREILNLLEQAKSYCPKNARVWFYHARLLKQLYYENVHKGISDEKSLEIIRAYLEKSILLNPTNANLHMELGFNSLELGRVYKNKGLKEEAKIYFKNALKSIGNAQILAPTKLGIQKKIHSACNILKKYR